MEEEILTTEPDGEQEEEKKQPLWKRFTNKYVVAILVFVTWMLFFDSNNFISQFKKRSDLNRMLKKRTYYLDEIKTNERLTNDLKTSAAALERYAREEFLMKRENEDVFLIIEQEGD
jgi:cell division protein DivIC